MLGSGATSWVKAGLFAAAVFVTGSDHFAERNDTPASASPATSQSICLLSLRSNVDPGKAPVEMEDHVVPQKPKKSLLSTQAKEHPSSWFGGFDQAESTFNDDAVGKIEGYPEAKYLDGWAPNIEKPITDSLTTQKVPAHWFTETDSGGPSAAWQTYYPPIQDVYPRGDINPPWVQAAGGRATYKQIYKPGGAGEWLTTMNTKEAPWFDSDVVQYDVFGRPKEPDESSGRYYVEWTKRTRTAPLKCGPIGCVANASIQAFDSDTELAQQCQLSVKVHATDFDDEYSREHLEWIIVNNRMVNSNCDPMAQGDCDTTTATEDRPLYSCLTNFGLDTILTPEKGTLDLAGKLSPMVDECPVDGNLLSGVAAVTCFVRAKPTEPEPPQPQLPVIPEELALVGNSSTKPLQCAERGCTANTTLQLNVDSIGDKTCKLTVRLYQTDFDGDLDSTEEVEWVKIDDEVEKEHVKPGRNPCKEKKAGQEDVSMEPILLVEEKDVTEKARSKGIISVAAKISDMVDECGVEGFLLKGDVTLKCE